MARERFNNKIEYFLTALSYAVGLGNVWRFPYLCYRNGGGSFFIPYILSLVLLGFTFFFFESTIGQFTSLGPMKIWKVSPIFRGIGYASFLMCAYVGIYYNMIIAWSIYYVYASFFNLPDVPWSHCQNDWNSVHCVEHGTTAPPNVTTWSPSQEFFYNQVLDKSDGIDQMVGIKPHLVICLAISWVLVFAGLSAGTKSLGKISYFTAIFPYVMLTVLIVKGAMLEGSLDGIIHYIEPNFDRLGEISVWADAGTQIFYSLSIAMGGVITLASYNPFHNNTIRDTIIIVICNSLTSVYAGFAIFSIIGFMAKQIDKPIDEAADQGVGLAFVAYPAALSRLPAPYVWSVIFFLMLITLGFGSQMTIVQTVVTNITDLWPEQLQNRKTMVLGAVCFVMFLTGLPMCTGAGVYILQLMDNYSVPYVAFVIAFCEVMAIAWVYGVDRHMENIRRMLGFMVWPRLYWKIMFKFVAPTIIAVILIIVLINFKATTYNEYEFPLYADLVGWAMTLACIIMIPAFALYEFIQVWQGKKTYKEICKPEVHFNNDIGDEQTNDIEITQPGFPRFTSDKEEEASRSGTNGHRNGHVN